MKIVDPWHEKECFRREMEKNRLALYTVMWLLANTVRWPTSKQYKTVKRDNDMRPIYILENLLQKTGMNKEMRRRRESSTTIMRGR